MLREVAALCGVRSPPKPGEGPLSADEAAKEFEESGFDDEYESLSREDLIEQIFRHDTDGTVVTCAMDRKNVRMRTAADRALYYMLTMGEEVETLEARVRKTNKSIIKGTKGSADMMTFMNIH